MCCEEDGCALAVFNEVEAICYLKSSEALNPYHSVPVNGMASYTIKRRIGEFIAVT